MKRNPSKKKIIVCMFLLLSFIISFIHPFCVRADETQGEHIKVGFFKFAGYHDIDEYGNKSGYGYEFIERMARYDNNEYEFVGYERGWKDMLSMLDNGEIDMLSNVAKTPERETKYLYSAKTIGNDGSLFTVRDDNEKVVTGNYASYNGIIVGSIKDSVQIEEFKQFAKDKKFLYTMKTYETELEMEQALADGEIEGIVSIGLRNLSHEKVIEQINKSDMYIIVRKEDTELMDQINLAIDRMDLEASNWRSELFDKYYQADQGTNISFLSDEIDFIDDFNAQNKVLKVAVNPDRKPYSYYEDGKIQGIIPRIFDEVANRIGIQYEIQVVKTREEYQNLLKSGDIDACLDIVYSFSEAEEKGYKITDSYLTAAMARIVQSGFQRDLDKIAVLKNADLKEEQLISLYQNVQTVSFDNTNQCIEAVKKGEVDATYVYSYAAQIAINEDPDKSIGMNILMDYGNDFSIGVPKNRDYHLIAILNKGVKCIEEKYIQNIIMDETDYQVDSVPFAVYLRHNPVVFLTGIIVFLLIIIGTVGLLTRIRYVNQLKEKEENKNKILKDKAEQEAEFVQAMTYVCKTNELVQNVNLIDRTMTDYYLENGVLKTKTSPYKGFDLENYDATFFEEDYKQIVHGFDEEKVKYLSRHGGGEEYFECRAKNKAGEYRWYGYTLQAVPVEPVHPCNYIVYKKDIHEAKLKEIKVRQNLEDALKVAREASTAKGQFMSRMSHEIRTPLNAVLGYMNMAKQPEADHDKIMHCIGNSEIAAKHLLNIINDVLDMSAIESGKIKIASSDFNLSEILQALETVFSNQASSKKIQFNVVKKNIKNEWLIGDPLRLNQILMNLLSNAMKFTEENGHVTLEASQISHAEDKTLFQFVVSDDGIGMSEEFQTRLYQSFEQASAQTAVKYGGSGLGLSITKNLITMMNGSIDVKSKEGEGTIFTVVLALGISSKKNDNDSNTIHFDKQRILVVEDNQEMETSLKKILKSYGLKIEIVHSIEEASKKIKAREGSDFKYDLCMIDSQVVDFENREHLDGSIKKEILTRPISQSILFNLLIKHFEIKQNGKENRTDKLDISGIRVLLAEDNKMNMEIATDILSKFGIIVEGVQDGKEALDTFVASEKGYFQAILMDVQMPVMDGYEATKQIRKSSHVESKTIPIIAMTANAFTEDVSAAISAGMNDHISKPINFEKLYDSLKKLIK